MKNLKNYKNLFALLALAVIFAVAFAGCGYSGGMDNKSEAILADRGSYDYDGAYNDEIAMYDDVADKYSYSVLSADAPPANNSVERKIIRDANVTLEVENVEKAYETVLEYLKSFGGYKADDSMQTYNENSTKINATFKVPSGKLDDFLAELKKEGKVISLNTTSDDITDKYYDAKIRLDNFEKELENYREILKNTKTVEEHLQVTQYINDVTYRIEQIKGSLKLWDSLVDYSTVVLSLYEPYEAPAEVRELKWDSLTLDDMGWFISSGFLGVCNLIFSAAQWILIGIVILSPVIIPAAVVLFFVIRAYRKNQKRPIQNIQQNQSNNNAAPADNSWDNKA